MTPAAFRNLVSSCFSYLLRKGFRLSEAEGSPWDVTFLHENCELVITYYEQNGDWAAEISPRHFPRSSRVTAEKLYQYFARPKVDIAAVLDGRSDSNLSVAESLIAWAERFAGVSLGVANFFDPATYEMNLASFSDYEEQRSHEAERQLQEWEAGRRRALDAGRR